MIDEYAPLFQGRMSDISLVQWFLYYGRWCKKAGWYPSSLEGEPDLSKSLRESIVDNTPGREDIRDGLGNYRYSFVFADIANASASMDFKDMVLYLPSRLVGRLSPPLTTISVK